MESKFASTAHVAAFDKLIAWFLFNINMNRHDTLLLPAVPSRERIIIPTYTPNHLREEA